MQNLEGNVRTYRIPDLDDGVSYFHIRAVDGAGNYSRTVHFPLQVSRNPLAGPLVVSCRPIPAAQVDLAAEVSGRYPAVHGAPVQAPGELYIMLNKPAGA